MSFKQTEDIGTDKSLVSNFKLAVKLKMQEWHQQGISKSHILERLLSILISDKSSILLDEEEKNRIAHIKEENNVSLQEALHAFFLQKELNMLSTQGFSLKESIEILVQRLEGGNSKKRSRHNDVAILVSEIKDVIKKKKLSESSLTRVEEEVPFRLFKPKPIFNVDRAEIKFNHFNKELVDKQYYEENEIREEEEEEDYDYTDKEERIAVNILNSTDFADLFNSRHHRGGSFESSMMRSPGSDEYGNSIFQIVRDEHHPPMSPIRDLVRRHIRRRAHDIRREDNPPIGRSYRGFDVLRQDFDNFEYGEDNTNLYF